MSGLILAAAGCGTSFRIKDDPFFESFYEKAEIIMTKDEKEIYRRLPDTAAREEFIEDFWKIRDPDQGTEENENKIEFEERIEYANKWFGKFNPYRGREQATWDEDLNGWATERGRIYIIMGPPDELHYDAREFMMGGRITTRPEGISSEQWVYYRYNLVVYFRKRSSSLWSLTNIDSILVNALEAAKLNLVDSGHQADYNRRFRFKAEYRDGGLRVTVPLSRLNFKEEGGRLFTDLRIFVNVYFNDRKRETLERIKTIEGTEDELTDSGEISFMIPYVPESTGRFLFDIIIEDTMAISFSKFRVIVKKNLIP